MNIANEVDALIAAIKRCLGHRPCDFLLMVHKKGQSLTSKERQMAKGGNHPILIRKHDGSFSIYGLLTGDEWKERRLSNLTKEEQKALTDLDFAQKILKFKGDLSHKRDLISALEKGHSDTIYEQSLKNMFHNLINEGLPELKIDPFYYPVYEICATEYDIPVQKKPGYIYLYIQEGCLHYQTQWIEKNSESEEQLPIYVGTIDVDARLLQEIQGVHEFVRKRDKTRILWDELSEEDCINKEENLQKLKQIISFSIQNAGHMQPFYEDRHALPKWYEEIRNLEAKILNEANELSGILCLEPFIKVFVEKDIELMNELKQNLAMIISIQNGINECLKDFDNSFQLIDHLKKAYGQDLDSKLYSRMTTLMKKLDELLKKYNVEIEGFFRNNKERTDPNRLLFFLVKGNLTGLFSAQNILRRKLLFIELADYLSKGHKKFHELAPVYSAINESAVVANKAAGGNEEQVRNGAKDTHNIGLKSIANIIGEEDCPHKRMMLSLVHPIWSILLLDTQNAQEGNKKNDTAFFYLQRKIFIEQFEKFRKEWCLHADVRPIVDSERGAILDSGYKLVHVEVDGSAIRCVICLGENPDTEMNIIIENEDLPGCDIRPELNLEDASFTARMLWAMARKGCILDSRNEDIAVLLCAATAVINILSPEKCVPPQDKISFKRGERFLSGMERKPPPNRDMETWSSQHIFFDEHSDSHCSSSGIKGHANGVDKRDAFHKEIFTTKQMAFFTTQKFNSEKLKEKCLIEENCNAFYYLALAARNGDFGVPKDPVAAYYLARLAEYYLSDNAKQGGKAVEQLIRQLPSPILMNKPCGQAFIAKFGFDPKEEYLRRMCVVRGITPKLPNAFSSARYNAAER